MPIYNVSTRINSNVSPDSILYDLCIYRMDSERNKYIFLDVKLQPLTRNYETQKHATQETKDALSTIYIMEVVLYRKTMLKTICVSPTSFRKMYTLKELSMNKAYSEIKRENPCYFETAGQLRPVSEGDNTKRLKLSLPERAFIAKEYPVGSYLDPFEKNLIEDQIQARFNKMNYPTQGWGSLCGPAALFYCLQMDRPDVYAQTARDLWLYGKAKIGRLEIAPGDECRHPSGPFYDTTSQIPYPMILGVDWITLASLRDSENTILSYDSVSSPVAGVTMSNALSEWFEKIGYEKIFDNVSINRIQTQEIALLNSYIKKGCKVITLICDNLLVNGSPNPIIYPTHWVVWDGEAKVNNGYVSLDLFSWGQIQSYVRPNMTMDMFASRIFGGLVFKPLI
ncbi:hypothetical protein BIY26_05040 [Brenneria goodwinii]|uniref:Uncharacterized protein n=1 Tax=Brenneria goodwinii TaxID=1109412 RepID=A0AAE8EV97_9GAMM|nr:hypothetical protein AWC36_07295 [Brenneria goodwinii]RLM28066.1 hypothetical protein BIY26_05040 [Brenneria goodwinii]